MPGLTVTISPSADGSHGCTDVAIVDDASLEGFHNFSVGVESTSLDTSVVSVSSELYLILIQDNERRTILSP